MAPKKRVLVLGQSGMLGHMVYHYLSSIDECSVDATQRIDCLDQLFLDVETRPEDFGQILSTGEYHFIINCMGVLNTEVQKQLPDAMCRTIKVNTLWPHYLAQAANNEGVSVIHMSTDGVFSGNNISPYFEDDVVDCGDAYGQSKALGESDATNVLNIRCSIIGPDPIKRRGLYEWIQNLPEGSCVEGFENHVWNGVTILQFAQLCHRIICDNAFQEMRAESSVHHFCPNPSITKYQLLCMLSESLGKQISIQKVEHPNGKLVRVLDSRFTMLKSIFPDESDWENVIRAMLSEYGVNNKTY